MTENAAIEQLAAAFWDALCLSVQPSFMHDSAREPADGAPWR